MTRKLGKRQKAILLEALRRYLRFHDNFLLREAWTGLGTYTEYKTAVDAGLMEPIHPNHRCHTWWKLTPKGAEIVQKWMDAGITLKDLETTDNHESTCFGFVSWKALLLDAVKEA